MLSGWDTSGYNFVYTSGTISAGTSANGSAAQPFEAPGEFTVTNNVAAKGYGNTYMWGQGNGGPSTITTPPGGGNIVAGDGIYQVGAITQTINNTPRRSRLFRLILVGAARSSKVSIASRTKVGMSPWGQTGQHHHQPH